MVFKRELNSSYPHEWDRWEKDGVRWVIQDLPPEDDEKALKILVENLCTDEVLCSAIELTKSPKSIEGMSDFWRHVLTQRMSLGCYTEVNGTKTLVALNVCVVINKDDDKSTVEIVGEEWQNVYNALVYMDNKCNSFDYLGLDVLLGGLGLVVKREYRGSGLGSKLLNARQPLCLSLGIKGTTTVFSGISSQKSAAKVGFSTIAEASISELAETGLKFPKDDHRIVKVMVKKFV